MSAKTILLVDDQKNTLKVLSAILKDEGYEILQAGRGSEALGLFEQREDVDLVLSDLKLPGMDGIALFHRMREKREMPPFIIMTAYGTVKSAVQAMRDGVTNYLIKPLDFEELVIVVEKAIREFETSRKLSTLQQAVREENAFHGIIGASRQMRDIFDMVRTVGGTDASVMIYGETGTGKELLARALHLESPRRDEALVCINSAALTESLLEAELFGYVKGAFTGAVTEKKGRLEAANKGTLFLDEIGHMSRRLQSKLLRFLQEKRVEPVGGVESRQMDVRIIAATNLDLRAMIEDGRFLRDLLYRIEVISIRVPPLRERQDDIPLLTDHYIRHYGRQYDRPVTGITPDAMAFLLENSWKGNVRELKNCIARAVILSKGGLLTLEDLPESVRTDGSAEREREEGALIGDLPETGVTLKNMEAELIRATLRKCAGNKSMAAKQLGISRKSLYEKMERYGIPRE
ncbi:MAG: sigma-54 dependent transcriptional regulator [Deltaproteobacteria bacterium]|nr:sigma-54 dependent transcriptional regulator [Deltaproteobacteria bacterium]